MKHLAGLKLSPEQYERLVKLCRAPDSFPNTYSDWLQLSREAEFEASTSGHSVRSLEIDVDHFADWCGKVGIVVCIDALKAYAIVQRLDPVDAHYGAKRLKSVGSAA